MSTVETRGCIYGLLYMIPFLYHRPSPTDPSLSFFTSPSFMCVGGLRSYLCPFLLPPPFPLHSPPDGRWKKNDPYLKGLEVTIVWPKLCLFFASMWTRDWRRVIKIWISWNLLRKHGTATHLNAASIPCLSPVYPLSILPLFSVYPPSILCLSFVYPLSILCLFPL